MNQKYKPGIYFGIYAMVLCLIMSFLLHRSTFSKYDVWGLFIGSIVGGAIGGFMFGWIWNSFKAYKAKSL